MKLEHLIAVFVRLFSIGMFIFALRFASYIPSFQYSSTFEKATFGITILVLVALSIILWKFPLTISRKISGFPSLEKGELETVDHENLLRTGLTLLGVYLLYYAISDTVYWATYFIYIKEEIGVEVSAENRASIISTMVEFVISVLLILGSKTLTKVFLKLRYE